MARRAARVLGQFDLESSLGFLVYKSHQRSFAELRRRLERLRLTPPQFGVLALLYRADQQTQAALCELGAVDPNTMVGIVDRLEAKQLTWKAYMQSIPGVGDTSEFAPVQTVDGGAVPLKLYAQKHNPLEYF